MATEYVTISIVNGNPVATPDQVMVSAGDTVVWQLAAGQNLRWPQPPNPVTSAIWHLSGAAIITGLHFVSAVPPATTRTVQATVPSNAVSNSQESYNVSVLVQNPTDEEDLFFLTTHRLDTFDPLIKVKMPVMP